MVNDLDPEHLFIHLVYKSQIKQALLNKNSPPLLLVGI